MMKCETLLLEKLDELAQVGSLKLKLGIMAEAATKQSKKSTTFTAQHFKKDRTNIKKLGNKNNKEIRDLNNKIILNNDQKNKKKAIESNLKNGRKVKKEHNKTIVETNLKTGTIKTQISKEDIKENTIQIPKTCLTIKDNTIRFIVKHLRLLLDQILSCHFLYRLCLA
jgi:hypothetical protein